MIRHCECVYYQDWHRTRPLRAPPSNFKPNVLRLPPSAVSSTTARESIFSGSRNSVASIPGGEGGAAAGNGVTNGASKAAGARGLPFDEEAKLVYGVVLSLRNMVKKLSGK
jgi:hypothetical protein